MNKIDFIKAYQIKHGDTVLTEDGQEVKYLGIDPAEDLFVVMFYNLVLTANTIKKLQI